MGNVVYYDEDARQRILAGAEILYEAVKTTMGPKGRNVVINKSYGGPSVTHDGVTVAKSIDIEVNDETLGYKTGAELIKQAANKMNDVVGDGTTTVTVLTYHILKEANKLIAAGHNPMLIRRGLESAAEDIIEKLKSMGESIEGKKSRIAEIATISAGDEGIGSQIAEVMDTIGKEGIVTVEEGKGLEMESEIVEGYTFDRGFVSPYMATDTKRMEAVCNKPAIVVTDKKISSAQELVPLMEMIAKTGKKDMVLIADDIDGEALGLIVLNSLKGSFNTVAVKAPSDKDRLQDIATLVGAKIISSDEGVNFEQIDPSMMGSARKVIVSKDATTIIEGTSDASMMASHLETLKSHADNETSSYRKETLLKRHASLSGKVAVIKVGGATETEIEEKKYRVDDAVAAVKAALSEGVVPGGGVTLVNVAQQYTPKASDDAVLAGEKLLIRALEKPFSILLSNSGINADEWLPQVRKSKAGMGLNVNDPAKLVDLKAAGVIDPVRVTREALTNAVSIAGTAMTMGALVVEKPEEKSATPPAMPGMGMY